jgi:hypothetical protein
MTANHNWLSRQEWAEEVRTMHYDQIPAISHRIADYATPEEIESLHRALLDRRKTYPVGSYERGGVNNALRLIKAGRLPFCLEDYYSAQDIMAEVHARHETARTAAEERTQQEIAATSIDDAAWEDELRRRAKVDAYFGKAQQ